MRLVLTLVCRDFETLQAALAEGLEAVAGAGQPVLEMRQLGEGALDLFTEGETPDALVRAAVRALERQPVDFCAQPAEGRRKRLLVADMDSTIIGCECLDELADVAGLKAEIAAITARAMAGEIPFEGALVERVSRLAGLELEALEQVYAERVRLEPGAAVMARTMARARGALHPRLRRLRFLHLPRGCGGGVRRPSRQPPDRRRGAVVGRGGRCRSSAARPSWPRSIEEARALGLDLSRDRGDRRWGQRPGDDRGGGPGRGLPRQADRRRTRPARGSTTRTSRPCSSSRAMRRTSSRGANVEPPASAQARRGRRLRHGRPAHRLRADLPGLHVRRHQRRRARHSDGGVPAHGRARRASRTSGWCSSISARTSTTTPGSRP